MAEKMTLARPYAKAAFQYALTNSDLDSWSAMLANAAEMVRDPNVKRIITNPTLTRTRRADFFAAQNNLFDEKFCNFIRLTSDYDRLDLLPEISSCYESLKLVHNAEVNVIVTSAVELNDIQKQTLKETLSKRFDRKINVSFSIDESIIGGLIIKSGDVVIDSSVRGQLKKLMTNLVN